MESIPKYSSSVQTFNFEVKVEFIIYNQKEFFFPSHQQFAKEVLITTWFPVILKLHRHFNEFQSQRSSIS